MKRIFLFFLCLISVSGVSAQEKMYIHKSDHITLGALIAKTDSIFFSDNRSTVFFCIGGIQVQYPVSDIDSISFAENSNTIYITYNGKIASVINPLAFEGVSVTASGANVTVTSTTDVKDINYKLSGETTDGMFKIYSGKRFNLILDGIEITNSAGPAINIQSNNKVSVSLIEGSVNKLADGTTYNNPTINSDGEEEDQDAAFFSEGKLVFSGTGNLTINGRGAQKHALCSDDLIEIDGGTINIISSPKDGIHGKNGVVINGGNINIVASGDAIDGDEGYVQISSGTITTTNTSVDVNGISCDSTLVISGGTINMTLSGNQSKGITSKENMTLSSGNIVINTSGSVVLEVAGSGYDPSYCTAIKCDSAILISGADITIKSTGVAGKGISSDTEVNITSGTINITTSGNGATYTNTSGVKDSYSSSVLMPTEILVSWQEILQSQSQEQDV
jgi:trimeric autotransporter adhesin